MQRDAICNTLTKLGTFLIRYCGIHVSSTLTIQSNAKPGCTLKKKLCDYIRPKCYPLLYDSNINSLSTVALNAYQTFLLSAMKFHCSVRSMPSIGKLNPSYILGKILFSFRYSLRFFFCFQFLYLVSGAIFIHYFKNILMLLLHTCVLMCYFF